MSGGLRCVPEIRTAQARAAAPSQDFSGAGHEASCPSCRGSWALAALRAAVAGLGLERGELFLITEGEACAGWTDCLGAEGFRARTGAALPIARGVRLARPGLWIAAAGDLAEPGTLVRAARQGLEAVYLWQASPGVEPWLPAALASGATFAARVSARSPLRAASVFAQALAHKGFAFVECVPEPKGPAEFLEDKPPGRGSLPAALALASGPGAERTEGIFYRAEGAGEPAPALEPLKSPSFIGEAGKIELLETRPFSG